MGESRNALRKLASHILGQRKPLSSLPENKLKQTLGALDLILIGIGGIIGTGIFVLTGHAAAAYAGPAVTISFIISGFVSGLAALCYAELASMIPVSGSAYTYVYVTMGELMAWVIGWDLMLEYLVGGATVAVGWSGYFVSFLKDAFQIEFSNAWATSPFLFNAHTQAFEVTGAYINLPAVLIVLIISVILFVGVRESTNLNAVVVSIKLLVIVMFIFASIQYVDASNWSPFIPENNGTYGEFGWSGVLQASSVVFFAYIGFDAVSTCAQECKNPSRDLPIGIIGSLSICIVLYLIVSLLLTGMVHYTQLNVAHPIALAFELVGLRWMAIVVELGAIAGLTSVLLVGLFGQSRVFFSIAQDGLLPPIFAVLHPKFHTPQYSILTTAVVTAVLAGLFPIDLLGELTSIGTLFAFFLVCLGVLLLRFQSPDAVRLFKVPFGPYFIPILGAFSNLALVCTSSVATILRLLIWMAIGLVLYFAYGRYNSVLYRSKLNKHRDSDVSLMLQGGSDHSDELVMEVVPGTQI